MTSAYALSGVLGLRTDDEPGGPMITTSYENADITALEIDIDYTNLTIKTGEFFKVETNNSDIDAGVGNLNINLQGFKEAYKIKANKGIGNIKIDGRNISNNETYGNGENYIEVDGGIGNIDIDFE